MNINRRDISYPCVERLRATRSMALESMKHLHKFRSLGLVKNMDIASEITRTLVSATA